MFGPLPGRYFLTTGRGEGSTELNAFDSALLDAGIGDTNLVRLSSILPPGAEQVEHYGFPKGSLVPLAYGEITCSVPGTVISASIAAGIPYDTNAAGLIMECARIGDPGPCENAVRAMVAEGMEDMRGLRIQEIKSVSISHTVTKVGTVFAAVVLCP